jgi:RNA polymerase sigma factor (sigma-70 family)
VNLAEVEQLIIHSPVAQLNQQIDADLLFDELMQQLSPTVQALFALRYIDDLTYERIAELTQQTPANIRKIFSLTHKKLRQYIEDQELGAF